MITTVSSKGRVVLPGPLRRKLGIRTGDSLQVKITGGKIVLTPRTKRRHEAIIVRDPITGLPVLMAGPDAPVLTSKEVRGI